MAQAVRKWLKAVRAEYDLSQTGLADAIGVSRSAVGMWETGSPIDDQTLEIIKNKFPRAAPPPVLTPLKRQTLGEPMFPASRQMVTMRYAGVVPCSEEWGDPLTSEVPIDMDPKFDLPGCFVCKVVGDSCWPALRPGDKTVWKVDENPPYGVIVIAQRRGDAGCTVKQLIYDREKNRPTLLPINTRYDSPPDGDGWDVTARLIGVVREADGPERTWFWFAGLRPKHLMGDLTFDD